VTADNASAILNAFKLEYRDHDRPSLRLTTEEKQLTAAEEDAWYNVAKVDEDSCLENEVNYEKDLVLDENMEAKILEAVSTIPETYSTQDPITRNSCLAHLLQLAIKDALKQKYVCELAKKLNSIVSWFNNLPNTTILFNRWPV